MGANFTVTTIKGSRDKVRSDFESMQDQDRYDNGHSYSGGWGMATGLTFCRLDQVHTEAEAYAWLDENCQKWEDALAVRLSDDEWMIGALCSS